LANCTCAAGFFSPSGGPCAPCPTGTYKNISGSAAACTPCPLPGQWSPKASAYDDNCILLQSQALTPVPIGCSSATDCLCLAGFFGPTGGPCAPCPTGTYKNISGSAAACTPCPLPGQWSPKASAYADNCILNCALAGNALCARCFSERDTCKVYEETYGKYKK
jgi:hypothetical protein